MNRITGNASQNLGRQREAFTLIELLVVITVIAILAAMLLPVLARAKISCESVCCRNNLKQLQAGFLMYADENSDRQPPDMAQAFESDVRDLPGSWVVGSVRTDTNCDNIKAGVLYRYGGSPAVYHCPSDKSTVTGSPGLLRVRSYSRCEWVHAAEDFYKANGLDIQFTPHTFGPYKVSEHFKPAPSHVFAFIDEHQESINSGLFLIPQSGCSWWNSLPSDRHRQGSNLSFLDGHVEHWRWKAAKVYKGFLSPAIVGGDANDLARLQDATPRDLIR